MQRMSGGNRKRIYPDLKRWRVSHGWSQDEAARFLGINQGYYSKLERGEMFASKRLGKRISELANVPLEQVLGIA